MLKNIFSKGLKNTLNLRDLSLLPFDRHSSIFSLDKKNKILVFSLDHSSKLFDTGLNDISKFIIDINSKTLGSIINLDIITISKENPFIGPRYKPFESVNVSEALSSSYEHLLTSKDYILVFSFYNFSVDQIIDIKNEIIMESYLKNLSNKQISKKLYNIGIHRLEVENFMNFNFSSILKYSKNPNVLNFKLSDNQLHSLDIFDTHCNSNALILSGGNTDRDHFSNHILFQYLRSGVKVYAINKNESTRTLENFFDFNTFTYSSEISLNPFSLLDTEDTFIHHYFEFISKIWISLLDLSSFSEEEILNISSLFSAGTSKAFAEYKNATTFVHVVDRIKEIVSEIDLEVNLSKVYSQIEPFYSKTGEFFSLFNTPFNIDLSKPLTILDIQDNKIDSTLTIAYEASVYLLHNLKPDNNKIYQRFIFYAPAADQLSASELTILEYFARTIRKLGGSLITSSFEITNNNSKVKNLEKLFQHFSFQFRLRNSGQGINLCDTFNYLFDKDKNLSSGYHTGQSDIIVVESSNEVIECKKIFYSEEV